MIDKRKEECKKYVLDKSQSSAYDLAGSIEEETDELFNFINQNYISKEQILNLECLKEEVINKELERQAVKLEKMNDYCISADEILEDIGKSYNQRNEIRNEIKKEILKL